MKWAAGITTAPRAESYLERTRASVERAGWTPTVFRDETSAGAWITWRNALDSLSRQDCDLILLSQDDVAYSLDCREFAELVFPGGCLSLYCSRSHSRAGGLTRLWRPNIWGSCSLVFDRDTARRVVAHNWAQNPRHRHNVDVQLGRILRALSKPMWIHHPSLTQHIGHVSSIPGNQEAAGRRSARDFIGDNTSAMECLCSGNAV